MSASTRHHLLPILGAAAVLSAALSCYSPDLGDNPFKCSSDTTIPECPEDYDCVSGICVRTGSGGPGDGGMSGVPSTPDPFNCPDKDLEPNDTKERATPLGLGRSTNWAICSAGDKDFFRLSLAKDTQIKITLKYRAIGAAGHLDMIFFGGTITELMPVKSFPDPAGKLLVAKAETTRTTGDETFYLRVAPALTSGGPNFFELEVAQTK